MRGHVFIFCFFSHSSPITEKLLSPIARIKGPSYIPKVTSVTSKKHEIRFYFRADPIEKAPSLVFIISINTESTNTGKLVHCNLERVLLPAFIHLTLFIFLLENEEPSVLQVEHFLCSSFLRINQLRALSNDSCFQGH